MSAARLFVRDTLSDWGLRAAYDAAEMLVSEVVTNAVLHARTPFSVEVSRGGDAVRVSVSDGSPALPRQRTYGTDATTGRGIRLVATLSVQWGVEPDGRGGKVVWFEVAAAGDVGTVFRAWEDDDVDVDALLAAFDDETGATVVRALLVAA